VKSAVVLRKSSDEPQKLREAMMDKPTIPRPRKPLAFAPAWCLATNNDHCTFHPNRWRVKLSRHRTHEQFALDCGTFSS
jgi:hypothetical protein